jgi:hypothetical protein
VGTVKRVGDLRNGAVFVHEGRRIKAREVDQWPECARYSKSKVHVKDGDGGNIMCFEKEARVEIL